MGGGSAKYRGEGQQRIGGGSGKYRGRVRKGWGVRKGFEGSEQDGGVKKSLFRYTLPEKNFSEQKGEELLRQMWPRERKCEYSCDAV